MEAIKVILFLLGSFFGIENNSIIADKTTVIIDTQKQHIAISQENLFALIRNDQDSIKAKKELYDIGNPTSGNNQYQWRKEFLNYKQKSFELISDQTKQKLNATISLTYDTKAALQDFAIDYNKEEDSYALINIDSWNITSTTGTLKGNYWYFKDVISFTLCPSATMPEKFNIYKKSMFNYWQEVKQ